MSRRSSRSLSEPKFCPTCGNQITRNVKRQIYCSRKCWYASEEYRSRPGSRLGKKNSPEQIEKFRKSATGKKRTGQALENIRIGSRKNRKFGPDHHRWKPGVAERRAIKKTCHTFIWNALGLCPSSEDRIISELGYSAQQLKEHLEGQFTEGMTWENHSRTGWHIDHIRPIYSFPPDAPLSEVNALSNLRPLWAADNLRRYWREKELWKTPSGSSTSL